MFLSVFDIFRIGIGPSSSHTVGPMRAALAFARTLQAHGLLPAVARIQVELFGSLAATGRGHATDTGVLLGLMGEAPETVRPDAVAARVAAVRRDCAMPLLGLRDIAFDPRRDIAFRADRSLPAHPNAMRLFAFGAHGALLCESEYYSVGGGFVVERGASADSADQRAAPRDVFHSGDELVSLALSQRRTIAGLMLARECTWRPAAKVRTGVLAIWDVMQDCVQRGLGLRSDTPPQTLPGALRMRRRAPELYRALTRDGTAGADPMAALDWVNAYAMAVNEENAAGGRVVTAPTNGAAGIVPAVLHYYTQFVPGANEYGVVDFLLTAAAIGILYKTNASISGAEVGCQGEVGVACSMAAAGLAAAQGGTPKQVENAAEIGMEHNLGLTCDPVGGMVQIPCVERNAMGAVKAINAARMALRGDGSHYVSLDTVIKTMMQTGEDMKAIYKETSLGGLAVNVVEC